MNSASCATEKGGGGYRFDSERRERAVSAPYVYSIRSVSVSIRSIQHCIQGEEVRKQTKLTSVRVMRYVCIYNPL
jgi:hypothetical protein